MRINRLTLKPYGECSDVTIEFGRGLTVVLGANEAGKSTALDALTDLLWGIPVRSPRDSKVNRRGLRIVAEVQTTDGTSQLTRRADGLYSADQVTHAVPPWDRELNCDRSWWRTRFGISHDQLREGGREVFLGQGDLAELVFAAREGASARVLREEIARQVDVLFKPNKNAKNVALRKAAAGYAAADLERRSVLTQASTVLDQRGKVELLEGDYEGEKARGETAARALQRAREDERVIVHVLALRAARGHLLGIAKEGDRLSPEELAELAEADESRGQAEESAAGFRAEITKHMNEIDQLLVEEPLLAVQKDIDRLAGSLEARLDDLRRADDEYLPDVEKASDELRRRLVDIGVSAGADLDKAIAVARVRVDYAATLNELTDSYEALTDDLEAARVARVGAESALLGHGIHIDPVTATVPHESAVSRAKADLSEALEVRTTLKGLEKKARGEIRDLEASTPLTPNPAHITRDDVDGARHTRDEHWSRLREVWLTGEPPEPRARRRSADDLTEAIAAADGTSDLEANEREQLAREMATAQAHNTGLAKKQHELADLIDEIEGSQAKCDEMQRAWDGLWQSLGVSAIPDIDHSAQVLDLLRTWHKERFAEDEAGRKLADLETPWRSAAELAGLNPAVTAATWRMRADILKEIEEWDRKRNERRRKEAEARTRWATYASEARSRLATLDVELGPKASPAQIESGILQLQKRLISSRGNQKSRTLLLSQINKLKTRVEQAGQEIADAGHVRTGLGQNHGTDPTSELDILAQRARDAQAFVDAESESLRYVGSAIDVSSAIEEVIGRLERDDEVAVSGRVNDAVKNDDQVDKDVADVLERLTTERNTLKNMEGSGGAAEAQAAVASHQACVAHLTEQWAVLALQQDLLSRTLDTYGRQDSWPLLRSAGEILDRLTAGRWVALSAHEEQETRTLRVIRSDGESVEPRQLSDGTADQVFLALRLAAVAEQHAHRLARGEPALPLVLDDALIAFDDSRTVEALKLLHELAADLQVVVFTHHTHVASAAANLAGAAVSRMEPPETISGARDAEELRDLVQRPSNAQGAPLPTASQQPTDEADPADVRAWARGQGFAVAERGRVSQDVMNKYMRTHQ